MKKTLITKYVLISSLLSLFHVIPVMAEGCSGGPWNHELLFDVPPQSDFVCQDIVNSKEWLSSGCDAKYPGSVAVSVGSCEVAAPPYEYSAFADCACPQVQETISKLPTCSSSDASDQTAKNCPHLHQAVGN